MYIFASGKEPACWCRRHKRHGSIPGWERSPGGRHGNPLQYSCLENPMNREAWRATVHSTAKSQTWLKWLTTCACTLEKKSQAHLTLKKWGLWARWQKFSISVSPCVHAKPLQSFLTLWTLCTVACQAPLSMGFSRHKYWSGLPCPPPGNLLLQGRNPSVLGLLHWQVGSLLRAQSGKSGGTISEPS